MNAADGASLSSVSFSAAGANDGVAARPKGATRALIELAYRESGGVEVALWWNELSGVLTVSVLDRKGGDAFDVPAAADEALDVFNHPYAYAYARRVPHRDVLAADSAGSC